MRNLPAGRQTQPALPLMHCREQRIHFRGDRNQADDRIRPRLRQFANAGRYGPDLDRTLFIIIGVAASTMSLARTLPVRPHGHPKGRSALSGDERTRLPQSDITTRDGLEPTRGGTHLRATYQQHLLPHISNVFASFPHPFRRAFFSRECCARATSRR